MSWTVWRSGSRIAPSALINPPLMTSTSAQVVITSMISAPKRSSEPARSMRLDADTAPMVEPSPRVRPPPYGDRARDSEPEPINGRGRRRDATETVLGP